MAVISLIITESSEQIVSGIPKTVSLSTNIPATIFYTLDGSTPTLYSTIYTNAISMPTDSPEVILSAFATDGVDSSIVIVEKYFTNRLDNARLPRSTTTSSANSNILDLYPFGTNPNQPQGIYTNPGNAAINVNDPSLPQINSGYDAYGQPDGYTNLPYNFENYDIVYPTGNSINEPLKVGQLPSNITVVNEKAPDQTTSYQDKYFDPKAFVIYQDVGNQDPSKPPLINKANFSLENSDKVRTGNNYFVCGLDAPPTTGSFVKQHYNATDNTITYYYYDQIANRWIISKVPYVDKKPNVEQLSNVIYSRTPGGVGFVYSWSPWRRRILY